MRSAFFSLCICFIIYHWFIHREFWTIAYAVPTSASLVASTTGKMLEFFLNSYIFLMYYIFIKVVYVCIPVFCLGISLYVLSWTALLSFLYIFKTSSKLVFSRCHFIYLFSALLDAVIFLTILSHFLPMF